MTMKASSRQVEGVTIVDLSGRITLDEGSVVLRDTMKDLSAQGHKRIVLNLGDVTYIDSSGVGELVSAFTSIRNAGGELKLLNLTKKVHDLLQITKLYKVFDIQDDETAGNRCISRLTALQKAPETAFLTITTNGAAQDAVLLLMQSTGHTALPAPQYSHVPHTYHRL